MVAVVTWRESIEKPLEPFLKGNLSRRVISPLCVESKRQKMTEEPCRHPQNSILQQQT